jgi:serine phosphatase RsbU (regulator of sigma subunit)
MSTSQTEFSANTQSPLRLDLKKVQALDLHAEYRSMPIGGDFFDAVDLGSRVIFLLTDIAGTREATQPIIAEVQHTFRTRGTEFFAPPEANLMDASAQLVQEINHALIRTAGGVRFAPTFLGCYDLSLGVLAYINAGGMAAVFQDAEGARIMSVASVPFGLFTHLTFEPSIQAFEPGAKLLLVTKGVMETEHGQTHFGLERLIPLLTDASANSAAEICQAALKAAAAFKQTPWYHRLHLPFLRRHMEEDWTALAVMRSSEEVVG